jgi:hypothetical protein
MVNTFKGMIAVGVGIIILIHVKGVFDYQLLNFSFVPSSENAVTFIKESGLRGRIFNNYRIGNYLIYGLYPREQIFVDARPEAYPAEFFDEYWRMMESEEYFAKQVERYKINAVVFAVDDDPAKIRLFLQRLIENKDWAPVYADGSVTIFARDTEVNRNVIEKFRIQIAQ